MLQKPLEYWAVLIGMVLYAAARDAQREPIWTRIVKVFASGFLTIGLTPTIAPLVHNSETWAAVCVMAFGMIVLDVATALISDRAFIKDLIKARFGGGKSDG